MERRLKRASQSEISPIEKRVKTGLKRSEQQWKELIGSLPTCPESEHIDVLCHCTSSEAKLGIERSGKLLGMPTKLLKVPPQDEREVKGVWFMASLFKGRLPDMSPYGTDRAKYWIEDFLNEGNKSKWMLFFESTYYYQKDVQYIRLVLGKKTSTGEARNAFKWCKENLHEIELGDNPILCLDSTNGMHVIKRFWGEIKIYVEALMLGDIDSKVLTWDKVECMDTIAASYPTYDISPMMAQAMGDF